jgi:hypothetical protein
MENDNVSANAFFTELVWSNLWNSQSPYYLPNVINNGVRQAGVNVSPLGDLQIANLPPSGSFELMKSHDLEAWLPVATGYIGIQFNDVNVGQIGSATNGGMTYTDDPTDSTKGTMVATINLPGITVSGNYVLVATGLSQCALDTAGKLSFLPRVTAAPRAASAPGPTLDQYLQAAQDQRTRLWQTPNGGQLMDNYYDHNEVYNWLFENDEGVKASWRQPANQYFVEQTYQATQDPANTVVNNATYTDEDGETTSYNKNAIDQQIVLTFAALRYANTPPHQGCTITPTQFLDAGNAASSFGLNEVASTGNSSTQSSPMTVDDVYKTVSAYQPPSQQSQALPHTQQSFLATLTDKQRAYLQRINNLVAARATLGADQSNASATLIQGTFNLSVDQGGVLTVNAGFSFPASGSPTVTITSLNATFNISQINIQNISDWSVGKMESIGAAVSQALGQSAYIRNLLSDKVSDALGSDTLTNYLSTWINNTLAKALGPLLNPS